MNNKCNQKPKNKCHSDIKKYFFEIIYKNLANKISFLSLTYFYEKTITLAILKLFTSP